MRARSLLALGATLIALSGCASRTRVQPEAHASLAVGVENAFHFRSERGPVDVAGPAPDTLSLADAVRRTLDSSPEIQTALAKVRIAQAEATQTRLLPNPVVNVALRYPEGGGKAIIEAGLAADIISLLRRPGLKTAADNRLRASSSEAVTAVLDAVLEVQERYISVQALDAELTVLKERQGLVGKLNDLARSRLDAGEGTRLDLLTIETQRVELQTEVAEKELERREERLALARLIGQPSSDASWKIARWEPAARALPPEAWWVKTALEKRPEVLAQKFEITALGGELKASRLSPFDGAQVGADSERDPDWSVGPSVSVPLPLFDTGGAQRERARAALSEAGHKLTQVERQVIEETRRAYATLLASDDNLKRIRGELVPVQERRREQAEAQFKAGEADITALLIAEEELRSARSRLVETEKRAATSLVRLERAVGGAGVAASVPPTTTTLPTTQETK